MATKSNLLSMIETVSHRGPDDTGSVYEPSLGLGLEHSRLSIIDLYCRARKLMSNDSDSVLVTFNGVIYNYEEIRKDLICKGHRFNSESDTEVILKTYEEWGIQGISRFRGMFSLVLWDANNKKLFLVRDRLGVKPLYSYYDNQLLLFASELKAFAVHPEFKNKLYSDRPKKGFTVPIDQWLKGPLKSLVFEYLNPSQIREEGIFSPVYVQNIVKNFFAAVIVTPRQIWNLLVFELWYERWIKSH